jgi:hypothetical protein
MAYSLDIWALSSFPKKLFAMSVQRAGAARRTGARVRLEIGVPSAGVGNQAARHCPRIQF